MDKINMTPELGLKIKELRLKHNIKSIDLAQHIDKSPAYISKLEKGDIKQVKRSDLETIINYITQDEHGYEKFLEEYIKQITLEEDEDDIDLSMKNFDTIERKIPIPKSIINYIKESFEGLEISSDDLVRFINENTDLDDDFFAKNKIDKSKLKYNTWYAFYENIDGEKARQVYILLKYPLNKLEEILNGEKDNCSYTLLYAIVYHLLKLQVKNNIIDFFSNEELHKKTKSILHEHKFYSLADIAELEALSQTKAEFESLLSDFDKNNYELINELLSAIRFLSVYDVKYTNEILKGIVENLDPDISFALNFMAISLKPLSNASANIKKEFLGKVKAQVEIYAQKPEPEKVIERY